MKYKNKIFLTFDLDWAHDEVFKFTLDILKKHELKATIFITHETKHLIELRNNPKIELGIHTNFNNLLNRQENKKIEDIIDSNLNMVPEAIGVRCHALVQSSYILKNLKDKRLRYDSNLYIPITSGMNLEPFEDWNGLVRIPYIWEDDIHCIDISNNILEDWDSKRFLDYDYLKVFNFHPIHIFLNTENIERYYKAKNYCQDVRSLKKFINNNESNGTRVFFEKLIMEAKEMGYEFCLMKNIILP